MRGLTLDGVRQVTYRDDLQAPRLEQPTDALIRVRRAGLCGSDLHPYLGREPTAWGVVPGHEVVGDVIAVGEAVTAVAVGDRVVVPFTVSCGRCDACTAGLTARCEHSRLLGWGPPGDPGSALHGGQAEEVRVPLADGSLVPVPPAVDDVSAVLLCDNLPTGWYAAERADIAPGGTVAVVGLGAVGLSAIVAARALGAARIVGVDPVPDRLERAELLGAETRAPDEVGDLTAASVIEAAGPTEAQRLAAELVTPGGTLSIIAVQTSDRFGFTPVLAYDRNLTVRAGRAPVRAVLDRLLPRVLSGAVTIPTEAVVTHPDVPLSDGAAAYARFAAREPGLLKVVFQP